MKTLKFLMFAAVAAIAMTFASCVSCEGQKDADDASDSSSTTEKKADKGKKPSKEDPIILTGTPNVPNGETFELVDDWSKFDKVTPGTFFPNYTFVEKGDKEGLVVDGELRIPPEKYNSVLVNKIMPNYAIVSQVKGSATFKGLCSIITGKETIPCEYTNAFIETIDDGEKATGVMHMFKGERKPENQHWIYLNGLQQKQHKSKEIFEENGKFGVKIDGKVRIQPKYDELIPVTGDTYYIWVKTTEESPYIHFRMRIGDKWGLVHYSGAVIIPCKYYGSEPFGHERSQLSGVFFWYPKLNPTTAEKIILDCNGDPYYVKQLNDDDLMRRAKERLQKQYPNLKL